MNVLPTVEIIRSKRRSLSLHVEPDSRVVVKAPFQTSDKYIQQFLSSHEEWIQKQLAKKKSLKGILPHKYEEGEIFLYLGREVVLTYGEYREIEVKEEKLLFPLFLRFRVKKELTDWYIQSSREIITRRVIWYANDMNLSYTDMTFSDTKSKWGSCSHDNRLQFNWRLVMAPLLVINYVVVHELVHTVEKNHSRSFWSKVSLSNPSYKQQRAWLKDHGDSLYL